MPPRPPGPLLALLIALAASCRSAPEAKTEAGPYEPAQAQDPESTGFFLAQFDKSLRRWNELKLNPTNDRDLRTLRALEASMTERAGKRRDELVHTLETGPVLNRQVAAVALGFTHDPTVLSPLLSALSDPSPDVAQKALLGLGILASADTPLSKLSVFLLYHHDPWTRNNAAYAILRAASAGARSEDLAETARAALIDEEPGVRAQAASVLGVIRAQEAVRPLGDLLHDDTGLVVQAAAAALVRIAQEHDPRKGEVARFLVDALERLKGLQRHEIHQQLVLLHGRDLGDDVEAWRTWAHRMP